jgi:hypothetical protein
MEEDSGYYIKHNGVYGDPLVRSWMQYEKGVDHRILAPLSVFETASASEERVKQTLRKFDVLRKGMRDLLDELNDAFFCEPETREATVRVEALNECSK